ncbi:MAG: murein biosynthesis integral membrane protein MurJ [Microcella sp.]|nr:MAG: murein biosynthesis integral membrane protein MurJ [Microcella sp.]
MLLASGTVVSRLLGFVSAVVLAQTIGTVGAGADAFALANQLPNNIYAIVAGGVLSAVLVPQIVKAGLHDDGGARFVNRLVTLGFVVFLGAAVIATLAAPLLVTLYSQQAGDGGRGFTDDELALAVAFAYWCLPQVLFYAVYALLGEVLNARKVFGPFTWAPALNNVVAIIGLVAFSLLFSNDVTTATSWTPAMISVLAGSATLGIAVQALVLFAFWRRAGLRYRPDFRWRGVGLGATGRAAGWVFGMVLVTQLAGIVQANVASLAAAGGEPSLAVLRFSWLIFMLPHSVVTVSLATAYFTRMSQHARDGDRDAVRADVSESLRRILMIMVLATIGLLVVAGPFARVFGGTPEVVDGMARVIAAFVVGLIPFTVLFVVQRVFYSLDDTRTPFFIQLAQAGLFVSGAGLVATLPTTAIAVGLAFVTSLAGTAQTLIALLLLRRRLDGIDALHIARRFGQYAIAALPSSAAGAGVGWALGAFAVDGAARSSEAAALGSMVLIGVVMTLVYGAVLAAMRIPEFSAIIDPIIRRRRR